MSYEDFLYDCYRSGFFQVSENKVTYSNVLTYNLEAGLYPITEPVECIYDVWVVHF